MACSIGKCSKFFPFEEISIPIMLPSNRSDSQHVKFPSGLLCPQYILYLLHTNHTLHKMNKLINWWRSAIFSCQTVVLCRRRVLTDYHVCAVKHLSDDEKYGIWIFWCHDYSRRYFYIFSYFVIMKSISRTGVCKNTSLQGNS